MGGCRCWPARVAANELKRLAGEKDAAREAATKLRVELEKFRDEVKWVWSKVLHGVVPAPEPHGTSASKARASMASNYRGLVPNSASSGMPAARHRSR